MEPAVHDARSLDAPPADSALDQALHRDRLRQIVDGLAELAALSLPGDLLMDRVVARVREMTGAVGAVVELVDGDELEYVAATGSIAASLGLRLPRGASLSGLCVAFRALQYSEDTETDRRVDRDACRRVGARSMLVAPLMHRDEAVGVVKVVSGRTGAFDELDEYAVRLCAGLLAGIVARHLQAEGNRRLLVARSFALQRATAILDASPVAMVVHDGAGQVELWNAAAERLLGWTAAEAIGRPLPFVPADRLAAVRLAPAALDPAHPLPPLELAGQRRDGSLVRLRVSAAPLEDENGRPGSVVRTLEELSDPRLRAPAATPGEQRLRHITQHSPDAFVSIDGDGRVVEWNEMATGLFGWTAGEARGRSIAELIIPPAMRDAHHDGLMRAIARRRTGVVGRRLRLPAVDRDGRALRVEMSVSATWLADGPVFDAFLRELDADDPRAIDAQAMLQAAGG